MICAYKQAAEDSSRLLKTALTGLKPELHRFGNFEQLTTLASGKLLDLIFLSCFGEISHDLSFVEEVKAIPLLAFIPLIVQHPNPAPEDLRRLLASPVDRVLEGSLTDHMTAARLRMAVNRSFRDINVNPSSRLPGPATIEKVLRQEIAEGNRFAVCYADLDDFKAYNDYYGYFSGDKVIKMASRIIRDIVYRHQKTGFVGHIAGDDFIFVVDATRAKPVCSEILKEFDRQVPTMYEPRDRKNGFIISKSRRGIPETYPIMTLSIAVIINKDGMFEHVGELSHMIADLKSYTKTLPGSNFIIERRKKY